MNLTGDIYSQNFSSIKNRRQLGRSPHSFLCGIETDNSNNKIVQRFYETPAPLKAGRDLIFEFIPRAPKVGISATQHRRTSPFHSNKQLGIQI
jgi:hypothetical protein